jgi:hypothetical protein
MNLDVFEPWSRTTVGLRATISAHGGAVSAGVVKREVSQVGASRSRVFVGAVVFAGATLLFVPFGSVAGAAPSPRAVCGNAIASGKPLTAAQTKACKIAKIATPKKKAKAAAVAKGPAGRKVQGTAVTLGAGTFAGGKDVAVGLYDVTTAAGQSGNFIVTGTDSYDEILGADGLGDGVPSVRAKISTGDQIEVSGLSAVTFTPVTAPLVTAHVTTNIGAGTWVVGQDIGAGRYVATPAAGQSGNFIVQGNDSYDEILGGSAADGGVPSVTVTLSKGDVVDISGISQVTLTAQ